ncbi:MAG: hypothetical protein WA160_00915 [Pseudobdellovibrio sp.]
MSKASEKAMEKLKNANVYKNYEEFLDIVTDPNKGLSALYNQPGRWRYEKLKTNGSQHTIRLNDSYRVLFEIEANEVKIIEVSKTVTH